jgi:hypothetical protein
MYDPENFKLVPLKCPYRSRLALAMRLGLDDQRDKERLELAWNQAVRGSYDECGEIPKQNYIPTLDEAVRFIESNPVIAASILAALDEGRKSE